MTNRDWFGLALRLFGIWLLLYSIESIVPSLIMVIFMSPGMGPGPSYAFVLGFWFIGRTTVALVLVVFAPAIASRFYPEVPPQEPAAPGSESKPLRVGLQLLGMCAVLLAIQSVATVILQILSNEKAMFVSGAVSYNPDQPYLKSLINAGLNLAFAAVLLIWNERVVAFIERFRYVPERDAYEPPPLEETE